MSDSEPEPTGPGQPTEVVYEDGGLADGILTRAADDLDYRRQALDQARHWAATGEPVTTHYPGTTETTVVLTPAQANELVENLQTKGAASHFTIVLLEEPEKNDNVMAEAELLKMSEGLDWDLMTGGLLLNTVSIMIAHPAFFSGKYIAPGPI